MIFHLHLKLKLFMIYKIKMLYNMKRQTFKSKSMFGFGDSSSRSNYFDKVIISDIIPNIIKLKNEEFNDIKTFIESDKFTRILNIIKKFSYLPSAKLSFESIVNLKKGFDIKDELEYYKNIRYLEVLTQDRSRDIVVNTALVAEAMFSTKYVVYLSLYGFPDDGNFDEDLLNKI